MAPTRPADPNDAAVLRRRRRDEHAAEGRAATKRRTELRAARAALDRLRVNVADTIDRLNRATDDAAEQRHPLFPCESEQRQRRLASLMTSVKVAEWQVARLSESVGQDARAAAVFTETAAFLDLAVAGDEAQAKAAKAKAKAKRARETL
jgi:hypothetical protein